VLARIRLVTASSVPFLVENEARQEAHRRRIRCNAGAAIGTVDARSYRPFPGGGRWAIASSCVHFLTDDRAAIYLRLARTLRIRIRKWEVVS
jgi:hypothetical protein